MRALVIVHEPGGESVLVGDRLTHHGYTLDEAFICSDMGDPHGSAARLTDPSEWDLVAVMGSTHSLVDPTPIAAWIDDELDFLRRADDVGVPVLGVCFGAQALAAAHGGSVHRLDRSQIGWFPQADHPTGLPPGPWLEWHHDGFVPPAAADVLARDEWGAQVFTLRRNLAVQFHPEVTPAHVSGWIEGVGHELSDVGLSAAELLDQTEALAADAARRTAALVDWFVTEVATRP